MPRWTATPVERLLAKVFIAPSGCWEWTGTLYPRGYGSFSYEGKKQAAHRVSYRLFVGPIPDGLYVCHHCDNPKCVNPDHFFVGDAAANTQDAISKGRAGAAKRKKFGRISLPVLNSRSGIGQRIHSAKLTPSIVIEMRLRYAAGQNFISLARASGVCRTTARAAVRGVHWKHV